MNTEEIHLLNGVLLGDPEAANRFVRRYSTFIYLVIRDYRLQSSDTADIFQRVFVRLWSNDMRALRMWNGDGSFQSYLRPIVRNIVLDELRARRARFEVEIDDPPGGVVSRTDLLDLGLALRRLSPRDQLLIRLRHFEVLSYREIGELLDMTVNNVGVSLSRAEGRLRRIMESRAGNV